MDVVDVFYSNLYTVIMATCPVDTRNMINHIKFEVVPDGYKITITAPTSRGYDYALAVNEGLAAKAQGRPMSAKESHNFHWVQRAIQQAAELTAGRVVNEGGYDVSLS